MTKKTSNTTTAVEFVVGDSVTVTNAATEQEPAAGFITAISKGWYAVELDDPEDFPLAKDGVVSARVSSLEALEGDEDEQDEEEGDYEEEEEEEDYEEEGDEEGEVGGKMAKALRDARVHYTKALRPDGTPTAHSNDLIARVLLESEPLEVCSFADTICEEPIGFHAARYASLNNGQKRMNSGNKIRSHWRKAVELGDKTTMALIMGVLGLDEEDLDEGDLESTDSDFEGNHG